MARREPIAIVGIGCRLPGGIRDAQAFWHLLSRGKDAVGPMPSDRWDTSALYDPEQAAEGKMYVREGGFIDRPEEFDAGFFGISPREAIKMDPQHRLLLETSWEALENAGMAPSALVGRRAGMFVGIGPSDYARLLESAPQGGDGYAVTGLGASFSAGRLSYVLGLNGPTVAVDTACSSSLVALHLACQSLRQGECDVALAGGVQLMLSPALFVLLSRMRLCRRSGDARRFPPMPTGMVVARGAVSWSSSGCQMRGAQGTDCWRWFADQQSTMTGKLKG